MSLNTDKEKKSSVTHTPAFSIPIPKPLANGGIVRKGSQQTTTMEYLVRGALSQPASVDKEEMRSRAYYEVEFSRYEALWIAF